MELLPAELRESLPALYAQENERDPMVYVKFFALGSNWTWYATEGSPREADFIFFGWIVGHEKELGYFSLKEVQRIMAAAVANDQFGWIASDNDVYTFLKRVAVPRMGSLGDDEQVALLQKMLDTEAQADA